MPDCPRCGCELERDEVYDNLWCWSCNRSFVVDGDRLWEAPR